jgi:gliding motility-associated-like protein
MVGSGGTSPYMYALGAGPYSNNNIFSNVLAGAYTIHIKDANGCIKDTNVAVNQPPIIVPNVAVVSPSCYGYADATVTATASGGTPGFTYAISLGAFSATNVFAGLAVGTDTIHVKDNNGCLHDTAFTITQPTPLKIDNIVLSNVRCFGDNSGWIQVSSSGATPAYTYASNGGTFQPSNLLTNLYAGSQVVHVKDSHNCILDSNVTLTQPTHLAFVIDSLLNPTCEAYKNAFIQLHATGGTPGYLYALADTNLFSKQETYAQIPEGTYMFYIKDANNCIYDTSITFVGYAHIVIDKAILKNPTCYGDKDGRITLDVSGGIEPLRYRLNGSKALDTTSVFDTLSANTYTITILDSVQCRKDTTIVLTEPDSLHIISSQTPNDCQGIDNGGAIDVTVAGGVTPYRYLWSSNPGISAPHISGMPNGNYMVWVHDANNCADSLLIPIVYDDCCKPFVPDAFTPNGDGKNDLFRVRFKGDMKLVNFSIYDRLGVRVYYSIYIDQGWDGTFNGVPQDMGTYNYYIKAICGNKDDHVISMHGSLTLIR